MRNEKAMCMSFKTYDIDDVHKAMSDQSFVNPPLCQKAFNGKTEIASSVNAHQLSSHAALKAAKQKQLPRSLLSSQKRTLVCDNRM